MRGGFLSRFICSFTRYGSFWGSRNTSSGLTITMWRVGEPVAQQKAVAQPLLPVFRTRQLGGGSQTGSQVAEGGQISTVRVLASFSGRVDIGFAAPLFEMHAPAACFEEGTQVLQGWFSPGCLFPDKVRVERADGHRFWMSLSQSVLSDRAGTF